MPITMSNQTSTTKRRRRLTEVPYSPPSDCQVETGLQTQLRSGAVAEREKPLLREKRKLYRGTEHDDDPDATKFQSSSQRDGFGKGSRAQEAHRRGVSKVDRRKVGKADCDSRSSFSQQGKSRACTALLKRSGDARNGLSRESMKCSSKPGKESEDYWEGKKDKKNVWELKKDRQGVGENIETQSLTENNSVSGNLNQKKKRRTLVDGSGAAEQEFVSLSTTSPGRFSRHIANTTKDMVSRAPTFSGRLTRLMAKKCLHEMKKKRVSRIRRKVGVPVTAAGDSLERMNINSLDNESRLGLLSKSVELWVELDYEKSPTQLGKSVHTPSRETSKDLKVGKGGRRMAEASGEGSKDALKTTPQLNVKGSKGGDLDSGDGVGNVMLVKSNLRVDGQAPVPLNDQACERMTGIGSMKLRSNKIVGESKYLDRRPRKRARKQKGEILVGICTKDVDMGLDDGLVDNVRAKGTKVCSVNDVSDAVDTCIEDSPCDAILEISTAKNMEGCDPCSLQREINPTLQQVYTGLPHKDEVHSGNECLPTDCLFRIEPESSADRRSTLELLQCRTMASENCLPGEDTIACGGSMSIDEVQTREELSQVVVVGCSVSSYDNSTVLGRESAALQLIGKDSVEALMKKVGEFASGYSREDSSGKLQIYKAGHEHHFQSREATDPNVAGDHFSGEGGFDCSTSSQAVPLEQSVSSFEIVSRSELLKALPANIDAMSMSVKVKDNSKLSFSSWIMDEVDAEARENLPAMITSLDTPYREEVSVGHNLGAASLEEFHTSEGHIGTNVPDGGELPVLTLQGDVTSPETKAGLPKRAVHDLMNIELGMLDKYKTELVLLAKQVPRCPVEQYTPDFNNWKDSTVGNMLTLEKRSGSAMVTPVGKEEDQECQILRLEDHAVQKSMADEVKTSRKRKVRMTSNFTTDSELQLQHKVLDGHEPVDRDKAAVYKGYSKKGFLLVSTSVEPGGMRMRPRPLDPDQAIPIFFEGYDKELLQYDGGSFYKMLQLEEARAKRYAPDLGEAVTGSGGPSTAPKTCLVKKHPIVVPSFCELPLSQQTKPNSTARGQKQCLELEEQSALSSTQEYVRFTRMATRTIGHALGGSFTTVPSAYDMDDEDEDWLQEYNGSLCQRASLSEDSFEQLIELFEREFTRICKVSYRPIPGHSRELSEKGDSTSCLKMDVDSGEWGRSRMRLARDATSLLNSRNHFEGSSQRKKAAESTSVNVVQKRSEECCICNGGENSASNPVYKCQFCSINVHQSCYGILRTGRAVVDQHALTLKWCCSKCDAVVGGRTLPSISCAICCKSGGAMKPTVDLSKWAHVACALYTNETFFVDPDAMEPIDGLAAVEIRVKKQRERCGLCGVKEGSCVRCASRGCRAPFHISCGVIQGASFELRHAKQQVVGVRSFCPRHATFIPLQNGTESQCIPNSTGFDPAELLQAVSTESSDTLGAEYIRERDIGIHQQLDDSREQDPIAVKQQSATKRKRSRTRENSNHVKVATPRWICPSGCPAGGAGQYVHDCSTLLNNGGSISREKTSRILECFKRTCISLGPCTEEKLEIASVETSGFSIHQSASLGPVGQSENVICAASVAVPASEARKKKDHGGNSVTQELGTSSSIAASIVTEAVTAKAADSHRSLPMLETLDTDLAPPHIVSAVYSYWQSKRVKAKGPILYEFKQLQAARIQGIFNKNVEQSNEFCPVLVRDSPVRSHTVKRPQSFGDDPGLSRILELKQHLQMLRRIAGNVVHREKLKRDNQELFYRIVQQQLLLARGKLDGGHCYWCENAENLLGCSMCPKVFCFECLKHRRGYDVKGWRAALKLQKYVCSFCVRDPTQANLILSTFLEPGITSISEVDFMRDSPKNPNPSDYIATMEETLAKQGSPDNCQARGVLCKEAEWIGASECGKVMCVGQVADSEWVKTSSLPSTLENSGSVDIRHTGGIFPSITHGTAVKKDELQSNYQPETGTKLKNRKNRKCLRKTEMEIRSKFVRRTTNRIKKPVRSPNFVYDSEHKPGARESHESRTGKTIKLSELRDS